MTPNLQLPYLQQNQAQKHVTLNESLRRLDALVQTVAQSVLDEPPATPDEGACYIVSASPSGDWSGRSGQLAGWYDGTWAFVTPRTGWQAWVSNESAIRVWTGTSWDKLVEAGNQTDFLGVNAAADVTNRFALSSQASLFSHEGSDHRLVINKAALSDTASLVFQTGFSGRCEIGLTGGDGLSVKVSPDGSAWETALATKPATGEVLAKGVHSGEITLDNDTALMIQPPAASGMMAVTLYSETFPQVPNSGIICFDAGATPAIAILANGGKLGAYPNQALNGTTGADTQLNIGTVSGGIWIENRFGSSQLFRYFFFC